VYISPYCRQVLVPPNFMKFGIRGQLTDIITYVKFLVDWFSGYGVLTHPKLPFPIDLLRRPYNSVALPCDTVINNSFQGVILICKFPFVTNHHKVIKVRLMLIFCVYRPTAIKRQQQRSWTDTLQPSLQTL